MNHKKQCCKANRAFCLPCDSRLSGTFWQLSLAYYQEMTTYVFVCFFFKPDMEPIKIPSINSLSLIQGRNAFLDQIRQLSKHIEYAKQNKKGGL
jgi:hypothetical protein